MEADFRETMHAAAREMGPPIYGLAGPLARDGVLCGHGGRPCAQVTVRYRADTYEIEVTTSTAARSRLHGLLLDLVVRAVPWEPVQFPWTLTVEERTVTLEVSGQPTTFQCLSTSPGRWVAHADVGDRSVTLLGSTGVQLEDLSLISVAFELD